MILGPSSKRSSKNKESALKFVKYVSNVESQKYFAQTGLIVPANIEASKLLDNKEEINSEIALKVKEIMANIINVNKENIPSDAHFIYDLGATSLDYLTLLVKLREEFEVNFDFTNNNNCYNVEEFVKYITLCNK